MRTWLQWTLIFTPLAAGLVTGAKHGTVTAGLLLGALVTAWGAFTALFFAREAFTTAEQVLDHNQQLLDHNQQLRDELQFLYDERARERGRET